jgi:hypothetical protein
VDLVVNEMYVSRFFHILDQALMYVSFVWEVLGSDLCPYIRIR